MTAAYLRHFVVPAAFSVLPVEMASDGASALLIAAAEQESGLKARKQVGGGPARGLWQAERTGGCVVGVLSHPKTAALVAKTWSALAYTTVLTPLGLYQAIEHNDVLACCMARLLFWTLPAALPRRDQPDEGLRQYLEAWRPGAARTPEGLAEIRRRWAKSWAVGWAD